MLSHPQAGATPALPGRGASYPDRWTQCCHLSASFIFETSSILMLMELQRTCEGGQRLVDRIWFF